MVIQKLLPNELNNQYQDNSGSNIDSELFRSLFLKFAGLSCLAKTGTNVKPHVSIKSESEQSDTPRTREQSTIGGWLTQMPPMAMMGGAFSKKRCVCGQCSQTQVWNIPPGPSVCVILFALFIFLMRNCMTAAFKIPHFQHFKTVFLPV